MLKRIAIEPGQQQKLSGTRLWQFSGFAQYLILFIIILTGCVRPDPEVEVPAQSTSSSPTAIVAESEVNTPTRYVPPPTPAVYRTVTPKALYIGSPTPDPTRSLKDGDPTHYDIHIVETGETLTIIAGIYETTVAELLEINEISENDLLAVGQRILVPGGTIISGPSDKLIPDSELIYGPGQKGFDIIKSANQYGGFLQSYEEDIEGQLLSGPQILKLVASRQSVNPRLLFAVLEYQSGWVTQPTGASEEYPIGYVKNGYEGLYQQLSWAANKLNQGYYGRSEGGLTFFETGDGTRVDFARDINDGTAAVQYFFASYPSSNFSNWLSNVSLDGLYATYEQLFGNPFIYTIEPIWPTDLAQPALTLPWQEGETWYFTGGPHGGWASGSAWAAIDFAPPDDQFGCYISDAWITSMSDGLVVQSDHGAVVVDLDGDGFAGSGWAITYLHLETRDRVALGVSVNEGDKLGHPSCEGGYTNGTHVHISRTYNGRWVSADGDLPFVMDGWESKGLGLEYDGYLVSGDVVKEACECRDESNAITNE